MKNLFLIGFLVFLVVVLFMYGTTQSYISSTEAFVESKCLSGTIMSIYGPNSEGLYCGLKPGELVTSCTGNGYKTFYKSCTVSSSGAVFSSSAPDPCYKCVDGKISQLTPVSGVCPLGYSTKRPDCGFIPVVVGETDCQKSVRLFNINVGACVGANYAFGSWSNGMSCSEFLKKCSTDLLFCVNKPVEIFPKGVGTLMCPQDLQNDIINPLGDMDRDGSPNILDDSLDLDAAQESALKDYVDDYVSTIEQAKANCKYGLGGEWSKAWLLCVLGIANTDGLGSGGDTDKQGNILYWVLGVGAFILLVLILTGRRGL